MPRTTVTLTGNVSKQLLLTTGHDDAGFSLRIPTTNSAAGTNTLGGGTLTILTRVRENAANNPVLLDTPVITESSAYDIGGDVEVYATLTGSTSPTVEMHLATYK